MRSIRELRDRALMSRADLAREVGVVESTVYRWEVGEAVPIRRHARAMAKALGIRPEELEREDPPRPAPPRRKPDAEDGRRQVDEVI